jgi:hypothetical protein
MGCSCRMLTQDRIRSARAAKPSLDFLSDHPFRR